jgi:hypothetical protein
MLLRKRRDGAQILPTLFFPTLGHVYQQESSVDGPGVPEDHVKGRRGSPSSSSAQ